MLWFSGALFSDDQSAGYLATREDLEPFIAMDMEANGEKKLRNLYALHLVLELVVLLQTYLSPSHDCLRILVQKCLRDLKMRPITSVGEEKRYTTNFQLPSHLVKDQLAKYVRGNELDNKAPLTCHFTLGEYIIIYDQHYFLVCPAGWARTFGKAIFARKETFYRWDPMCFSRLTRRRKWRRPSKLLKVR